MLFTAKPEDIVPKGGTGPTGPTGPYVGKMKLTGFNLNPVKKQSTGEEWQCIQISFSLLEGEQAGGQYDHIEWVPDKADKAVNAFKRICHIIDQFYPGEDRDAVRKKVIETLECDSFPELQKKVIGLLTALQGKGHLEKEVFGKILPSVNPENGKATSPKFPNYIGFITTDPESRVLKISRSEQEGIDKWREVRAATPDSYSSKGGGQIPTATHKDTDFDF